MLAENTAIDVRTNWRSAILVLQDDSRFKNVEDAHDREDLFNDFVSELEKKEKEDRNKQRDSALKHLSALYDELLGKGLLSRKSSWSEEREDLLKRTKGSEFQALEDIEIKRAFQDFINKLEKEFKDEERLKRKELQDKIDALSVGLKSYLERLAFEGVLTWQCRWKNWIDRKELIENQIYQEIESLVGTKSKKIDGIETDRNDTNDRYDRNDKNDKNGKYSDSLTSGLSNSTRNVFERVSDDLKEMYKSDKRCVKDLMESSKYVIKHDSTYEEYFAVLTAAAGTEIGIEVDGKILNENVHDEKDDDKVKDEEKDKEREKGRKEKDKDTDYKDNKGDKNGKKDPSKIFKNILTLRPKNFEQIFAETHDDCVIKHEEEMKRQKRREDKYIILLQDFYNRSDHVGFEWEEAKKDLCKYSEYEALLRNDRKRIFLEYMKELEELMKQKNKSLQDSMSAQNADGRNRSGKDSEEHSSQSHRNDGKKSDEMDHDRRDKDGKRHKGDEERDRDRDGDRREHRGKDRGREEGEERGKVEDRGREREKEKDSHRVEKEKEGDKSDSRKRERSEKDLKDVEGEEGEEQDDENDKKSKKHRKEKSPKEKESRDTKDKDKKHKKVSFQFLFLIPLSCRPTSVENLLSLSYFLSCDFNLLNFFTF